MEIEGVKYEVAVESLNFTGLAGLFTVSLLFFDLKFSSFEIGILGYVGILFFSGVAGLFAVNSKSKPMMGFYKFMVICSLFCSIMICALAVYLITDIIAFGPENCNVITENECVGISYYLVTAMLILYSGISATIIIVCLRAFIRANQYLNTIYGESNQLDRLIDDI